MPRKRNEDRAAAVVRLLASGMTQRQAAAGLGVNQSTVSRLAGDAASPPGRPPAEVDVEHLRALRAEGVSWREIERRTGVKKSVAQRKLSAPGVDNVSLNDAL
jgi:DNA invertase Pin-like site-specific DNA recombinase